MAVQISQKCVWNELFLLSEGPQKASLEIWGCGFFGVGVEKGPPCPGLCFWSLIKIAAFCFPTPFLVPTMTGLRCQSCKAISFLFSKCALDLDTVCGLRDRYRKYYSSRRYSVNALKSLHIENHLHPFPRLASIPQRQSQPQTKVTCLCLRILHPVLDYESRPTESRRKQLWVPGLEINPYGLV